MSKMASQPKSFDLLNSPLKGTNLIEAGAGTGKTYTVAALFLRLMGPLITRMGRRQLEGDYPKLRKVVLERQAPDMTR